MSGQTVSLKMPTQTDWASRYDKRRGGSPKRRMPGAGSAGVQASAGGRINIGNALTRIDTSSDGNTDIRVLSGGYITAIGAQGGTNVTPLTLSLAGTIIK